jgi:eukaryotic-like serine/threonine-protein kinase
MSRIGDYELIDRYATGGVAEIYRARHASTGELVVIKRMRQDLEFDPEHQAGFLRELQVALSARHKNLIRGYTKGSINGLDYGVLEYVDGPDLACLLTRARASKTALPQSCAIFIARELLEGLSHAFLLRGPDGRELGLVHRDLSPKNVFLTSRGEVRIGDFGSALASRMERPDEIVGSPGYMSPEQASRGALDQRSDLYAVGLILFELLTGTPAFDMSGKAEAQLLKIHQRAEPKMLPASFSEELRFVVEIATAHSPDDRFPTARDMQKALERIDASPAQEVAPMLASIVLSLCPSEISRGRVPSAAGAPR